MLTIMVNGRPLEPDRAIREGLPLDTELVCPHCNSRNVLAKVARTIEQLGDPRNRSTLELAAFVPRLQDRHCQDCGERWQTVNPPSAYTNGLIR